MDRAFSMFSNQPNRRFVLNISIAETSIRLTQYNRARAVNGVYINATQNLTDFMRILVGLMFCEPGDIGYDPTFITVTDDETSYIMAGGQKYRIIEQLFIGQCIRGRGTVVWKATHLPRPKASSFFSSSVPPFSSSPPRWFPLQLPGSRRT